MPAEILDHEPSEIYVGTAVAWTRSDPSYSPADGTLRYAFQLKIGTAGQSFTKNATDNGDGRFKVELAPADSTGKTPGRWIWFAMLDDGSAEHFRARGEFDLLANPLDTVVDVRSTWERIRDAIKNALANDDQSAISGYSWNNRSLSKFSKGELLDALEQIELRIMQEENDRAEAAGEDLPHRSTIRLELP